MEMEMTCNEIFAAMPGRFLSDGAQGWNAVMQFKLSGDGGGEWNVVVQDGTCTVNEGVAEEPTATVEATAEVWQNMTTGKLNPMMAMMTGKLKAKGNLSDLMKLNDDKIFDKTPPAEG